MRRRRCKPTTDERLEVIEWALGLALNKLDHIIKQENKLMSELDDATNRIVADIDNAVQAIADLRAAIDAAGTAGADVTALNAAADKLEGALAPPAG